MWHQIILACVSMHLLTKMQTCSSGEHGVLPCKQLPSAVSLQLFLLSANPLLALPSFSCLSCWTAACWAPWPLSSPVAQCCLNQPGKPPAAVNLKPNASPRCSCGLPANCTGWSESKSPPTCCPHAVGGGVGMCSGCPTGAHQPWAPPPAAFSCPAMCCALPSLLCMPAKADAAARNFEQLSCESAQSRPRRTAWALALRASAWC